MISAMQLDCLSYHNHVMLNAVELVQLSELIGTTEGSSETRKFEYLTNSIYGLNRWFAVLQTCANMKRKSKPIDKIVGRLI